jgi:hypothetical protein
VDLSAAVWEKSTHSVSNGCVEVAFVDGQVAVRDSKDKDGAVLVFAPREWEAFLDGVADGQFRRPKWMARIALWTALVGLVREVIELVHGVVN